MFLEFQSLQNQEINFALKKRKKKYIDSTSLCKQNEIDLMIVTRLAVFPAYVGGEYC